MDVYRWAIRPLLFRLDAETSHRATLGLCRTFGPSNLVRRALEAWFGVHDPRLRTTVAGISFPNPVGLAAGFDKNAEAVAIMSRLGFGFLEVGSISERPSAGNGVRPRVWRLEADEGLRVYYGCPNQGAAVSAARLGTGKLAIPLGVNLVETNTGTMAAAEHAAEEIALALGRFVTIADYIVLNLSCPNMPQGGCGLFDTPAMLAMLLACCARRGALPPLFLKITPPGDAEDPRVIDPILEAVDAFAFVKGFILNIPNRDPYATLRTSAAEFDRMRGGVTGPSLRTPTNAAIRAWYARIDRARHALIGAGGIASAEDAYQTIQLGASLVQLYTALVYRGPGLVKRVNDGLCRLLERDGLANIGQAVGIDNRG
jgi:dihydroorotate dehydrogenase